MDKKREKREGKRQEIFVFQTDTTIKPPARAIRREAAAQRDGPEARPSLMGLIRREDVGGGDRQKRT